MAAYMDETERKEREQALEILKEQIRVEGELIGLYEQTLNEIDNKPIQHMFRMIRTDSMKHIEMLQSAQEIIRGQDILIEDRKDLKANLEKHLELEKASIEKGAQLLHYRWVRSKKGLYALIESWINEEKRHHNFLKELSEKPYVSLDSDRLIHLLARARGIRI